MFVAVAVLGCSRTPSPVPIAARSEAPSSPHVVSSPLILPTGLVGHSAAVGGPGHSGAPAGLAAPELPVASSSAPHAEPPIRAGLAHLPGYAASQHRVNVRKTHPQSAHDGFSMFQRNCAICHGADLKGQPANAAPGTRPLRDLTLPAEYKYGSSDQAIYRSIVYGVPRSAMGNYETILNEQQRWDLVNFLKSRWQSRPTGS